MPLPRRDEIIPGSDLGDLTLNCFFSDVISPAVPEPFGDASGEADILANNFDRGKVLPPSLAGDAVSWTKFSDASISAGGEHTDGGATEDVVGWPLVTRESTDTSFWSQGPIPLLVSGTDPAQTATSQVGFNAQGLPELATNTISPSVIGGVAQLIPTEVGSKTAQNSGAEPSTFQPSVAMAEVSNTSEIETSPKEDGCADCTFPQADLTALDAGTNISAVGAAKPVGTIPQLANYLVNGFWQYFGTIAHHWASTTITYSISGLNAAEQFLAQSALNAWHEVTNLTFVPTSGAANITYNHNGNMTAFESDSYNGSGVMSSATVDISANWITTDGGANDGKTGIDSYGYQTYIHETGHALGLGHQGPYNGSASYAANAIYADDTWQYSVMSYFSQPNYGGSYRYVITPEMADIYAVDSIYGTATTRTGNTVYGFHNTAGSIFDFTAYTQAPALTIYDSGGINTLDGSGYSVGQTFDLAPGHFSSVGGLVNNIGIGLNTTIQNAIGGSGNDTFIAGPGNHTFDGGGGTNTSVFTGSVLQYQVTQNADGSLIIVDQRTGAPDGTTTTFNTQSFHFTDQTYSLAALLATLAPRVIEAFGSTSLTEIGNRYYLYDSSGSGPSLKANVGVDYVAGQWGTGVAPIGAAPTASGYEVAWTLPGGLYTVWNIDSGGNFVSYIVSGVSGTNSALESLETSFHQDLNGDGVIGLNIPTKVIQTDTNSFGTTSLTEVGTNYYLYNSSGSGPSLKANVGVDYVAGQWGTGVAPIGAAPTASGYEVAWTLPGGLYTVWNTDSGGNFVSYIVSGVSGTNSALESLETSFNQDLNGDGVIGLSSTVISRNGTATQSVSVTVGGPGNDTFVFKPGVGASIIANAGATDQIELDGFSSVTDNNQLQTLLHDAQGGQPQSVFQSANDGHDTVIDLGNHDSITLANIHLADLHASNFIVH